MIFFNKYLQSFFIGFLINFYTYLILRIIGEKMVLSVLLPFFLAIPLLGLSLGSVFSSKIKLSPAKELILVFTVITSLFLATVNHKIYLHPLWLFNPNASIPGAIWYYLAFIFFLILAGVFFALLGWWFANLFKDSVKPFKFYAVHLTGFLLGGLAAYQTVLLTGPYYPIYFMSMFVLIFIKKIIPRSLLIIGLIFLTIYAYNKPSIFYTHDINNNYKLLKTKWSPYSKVDFISYANNKCLAGLYNNNLYFFTCKYPDFDSKVRRHLFKKTANIFKKVLFIGFAGGGSLQSYLEAHSNLDFKIDLVEIDPVVTKYVKGEFAGFNRHSFNVKGVNSFNIEGRYFMENTNNKYDFVYYDGLDTLFMTLYGTNIMVEEHLVTKEAYNLIFNKKLNPEGVFLVDVGGRTETDIEYLVKSLPSDVHYKAYLFYEYYFPFLRGIEVFSVFMSRSQKKLKWIDKIMKEIDYVKPLKQSKLKSKYPVSDLKPVSRPALSLILSLISLPLFFIGLLISYLILKKLKNVNKNNQAGKYFLLAGMVGGLLESWLVGLFSWKMPSPALAGVIIISVFIFGSIIANSLFDIFFLRLKDNKLTILVSLMCIILSIVALNSDLKNIHFIFISLAFGMISGFIWAKGISKTSQQIREFAFSLNCAGFFLGSFIFCYLVLALGFVTLGLINIILVISLLTIVNSYFLKSSWETITTDV